MLRDLAGKGKLSERAKKWGDLKVTPNKEVC